MSRGVVIFIEGDTEAEFYSKIINYLHSIAPLQRFKVDRLIIRNLKGIGNYKNRVKRVYENEITGRNPGVNFTVVLCYDTDVFDLSSKPPVVWPEVERELKASGVKTIIHIKAKRSIEDWFLLDIRGVLQFLKLPENTGIPKTVGSETLKVLFKKAGKVYIKGSATKGFVDALDIKAIIEMICQEIKKLCKELGIKCIHNKCRGGGKKR